MRPIRTPTAVRAAILALLLVPVIGVQLMLGGGPRGPVVSARQASGLNFDASKIQLAFSRIVSTGLAKPVFVTHAGDNSGRLFVVEQDGKIKVVVNGTVTATFLDITSLVSKGSERGLLGLAFHPNYASNGRFFVDYTNTSGDTVIAEFDNATPSDNSGDVGSRDTVLGPINQPYSNHNGGMLAFGPDGNLYIGMGDGGSAGDPGNRAQDTTELLGKILRIGVGTPGTYTIPAGNPYATTPGANEIWAIGTRNPWRFSFDRKTGDLWIGDVGQDRYEEVNRSLVPNAGQGVNYGWPLVEGNTCYRPSSGCNKSGKTAPMAVYSHSLGCSVTGGYVYRGLDYRGLVGGYLFGDYCSGRIWSLKASGPATQTPVLMADTNLAISSFGEGPDGKIYVTDLGRGDIWLVTAQYR